MYIYSITSFVFQGEFNKFNLSGSVADQTSFVSFLRSLENGTVIVGASHYNMYDTTPSYVNGMSPKNIVCSV